MSEIKKFTIINATITINSATKLHFNHNKCNQIDSPYIFATAYKCKEYVLLHELQGFLTDKVIEPETADEFQEGLHTKENPFYLDIYDSVYDSLSIKEGTLQGYNLNKVLHTYENEDFRLFKVDESSWTEVDLDLDELENKDLNNWDYFANGIISKC